ncbi:MAG: poly-gamma-glutamate synthase PgsB [Polyangiaceae bacterium]|nr:poly-gamma-glutamate synthase PgsB [Polyangiaceae bacterium]MCW5790519.1 poly-gamma-glutamate synthase PgsB [Polyangiaceae bacterium]
MSGFALLLTVTWALIALAAVELGLHLHRLRQIPIRVHVNGTRGKSSVVRLIAAGLRAGGKRTCAKTTGTLARMILPDAREVPIYRPAGANIIEQKRIVATAAYLGAEALVIECMALSPELQSLCELKLVRSTHGVITNARPDHLEVMGPTPVDVAKALAGMIPKQGTLFTAEQEHLPVLEAAARDRGSSLVAITREQVAEVSEIDLAGFSYTEHPDNVALALAVCGELGVDRQTALQGMWRAKPDPGAMTEHLLDFFGREIAFVNGFAANDPVSSEQIWRATCRKHARLASRIIIFNCRSDRPDRSRELARAFVAWPRADFVVLMGTGTDLFAREAARAGFDATRLVFAEGLAVSELFERVLDLVPRSALVMGLGNVGGQGLGLVRYFQNRARVDQGVREPAPRSWDELPSLPRGDSRRALS